MSRRREPERYWVHSQDEAPPDFTNSQLCILPVCSTEHTTDCTLQACLGCARGLSEDGMLCRSHKRRLFGRLRGIPDLYEKLELEVVEGTPPPNVRSSRGQASLPITADILDILRTDAEHLNGLESMEGWCRIVIEERRFSWPEPLDTVAGRLATACAFLRTHLDWITTQAWVDEMDSEVQILHRTLRSAVEPEGRWVKTRIPCTTQDCTGELWWDCLDPGNRALTCRACGDRWEPEAFWALAERTPTPVTLRDAEQFGAATYTDLRNWIARGSLVNHGSDGAPRVLLAEVMAARKSMLTKARTA